MSLLLLVGAWGCVFADHPPRVVLAMHGAAVTVALAGVWMIDRGG